MRIGEAPPPSVETGAITSFEQTYWMKSEAASLLLEEFDSEIVEPPW